MHKPPPILNNVLRQGPSPSASTPRFEASGDAITAPESARSKSPTPPQDSALGAQRGTTISKPLSGYLTASEIDFVVERIVEKHSIAMKHELKTVLGMLGNNLTGN